MNTAAARPGEATRARILEEATAILAREGLDRFVLREIAKRARVRLGNLQYYFPTRDDLLEAVIGAEFERNLASMRELDGVTDLASYVQRLADQLISEYTGAGGSIWNVLSLLHLHNHRFRDLSRNIYRQHFETIVQGLRRCGVTGRSGELLEKARLITAIVDGAALQAHTGPHSSRTASWRSLRRKTGELALAIAKA